MYEFSLDVGVICSLKWYDYLLDGCENCLFKCVNRLWYLYGIVKRNEKVGKNGE